MFGDRRQRPAAQLYAPYGGARYTTGTMPTAKGFTGQRADAASGLDYYGARYYDPVAGQFTSADTVSSGLSPYAYVKGNPETLTDPTGHRQCNPSDPEECGSPGATYTYENNVNLCDYFSWACKLDDKHHGFYQMWGNLEGVTINGHTTWTVLSDWAGPDQCDTTCHADRNTDNKNTKNSQVGGLRSQGYLFEKIGATIGLLADIAELLSGDLLGGLKILTVALGAVIGAITIWVGNSSGTGASIFDGIAAVLSVFLGVVNAVIAAASFGMWLGVALKVGLAAATGGLLPLLGLAASAGLAAVSYGFTAWGVNDLVDANYQDQMNVNDWCAQYGTGACGPA